MIIIKTPEQIADIRSASRAAAAVLAEVGRHVKAGISTAELDKIACGVLKEMGAKPAFLGYRGYRYATCLSINSEVVHGLPGSRVLTEGDIIGVDIGAIVNGFYGDCAHTYPVGQITRKAQKLLSATEEALYAAISKAREGGHLGDISAAVEEVARRNGFSVVRDLFGHGVGVKLHEDPLIPNFGIAGEGPKLKENMVFAIEPMLNTGGSGINLLPDGWTIVTADGGLSAHFEHTILIRKGEPEILTCLEKM